jgi:hypothetical protein
MANVLDKCTILEFGTIGTGVLVSNTTDSVGVRLDTAAGIAELVSISILGCMANVLDKCTILEFGTRVLVSNTTDSVGVRLDTAAGSTCLQYH